MPAPSDEDGEEVSKAAAAFEAAQTGDLQALQLLASEMSHEWLAALEDEDGLTLAHEAAMEGHVEVLRILGSDTEVFSAQETELKYTPCHAAAEQGHTGAVQAMAECCRPRSKEAAFMLVGMQNKSGNTPIALAAMAGHAQTLAALLAILPDDEPIMLNILCKWNREELSALQLAIVEGHVECVTTLVKFVIDAYCPGTPSCGSGQWPFIDIRYEREGNLHSEQPLGRLLRPERSSNCNAFHTAAEADQHAVIEALSHLFLTSRFDSHSGYAPELCCLLHEQDADSFSPFLRAVARGHSKCLAPCLTGLQGGFSKRTPRAPKSRAEPRYDGINDAGYGGSWSWSYRSWSQWSSSSPSSSSPPLLDKSVIRLLRDGQLRTGFHIAASGGHTEILDTMLNKLGADPKYLLQSDSNRGWPHQCECCSSFSVSCGAAQAVNPA